MTKKASPYGHRHSFDKTGRLPNGTVRVCVDCGERQQKIAGAWRRLVANMTTFPHIDSALAYLRGHGFPDATRSAVLGIAVRSPWLDNRPNGWQQIVRMYVEHPEWR